MFGDTQLFFFFLQKARWFLTVLSVASQTLSGAAPLQQAQSLSTRNSGSSCCGVQAAELPQGDPAPWPVAVPPRGGPSSVAGGRPSPRGPELRGWWLSCIELGVREFNPFIKVEATHSDF